MAFLAEHAKKLTDDIRTGAEARAAAVAALRTEAVRIRSEAKSLVTGARESLTALTAASTDRAAAVRGQLGGFAAARAARQAALKEQRAAARAARQEAVAALRQRARDVRETFANDRQLAARVWQNLRAARRPGV